MGRSNTSIMRKDLKPYMTDNEIHSLFRIMKRYLKCTMQSIYTMETNAHGFESQRYGNYEHFDLDDAIALFISRVSHDHPLTSKAAIKYLKILEEIKDDRAREETIN